MREFEKASSRGKKELEWLQVARGLATAGGKGGSSGGRGLQQLGVGEMDTRRSGYQVGLFFPHRALGTLGGMGGRSVGLGAPSGSLSA